ncbi:MAG: hypothetical protein H6581_19950 [Bacteroidia bacterium]|nr:hypothetical protein [Bacteroidia bacterium]
MEIRAKIIKNLLIEVARKFTREHSKLKEQDWLFEQNEARQLYNHLQEYFSDCNIALNTVVNHYRIPPGGNRDKDLGKITPPRIQDLALNFYVRYITNDSGQTWREYFEIEKERALRIRKDLSATTSEFEESFESSTDSLVENRSVALEKPDPDSKKITPNQKVLKVPMKRAPKNPSRLKLSFKNLSADALSVVNREIKSNVLDEEGQSLDIQHSLMETFKNFKSNSFAEEVKRNLSNIANFYQEHFINYLFKEILWPLRNENLGISFDVAIESLEAVAYHVYFEEPAKKDRAFSFGQCHKIILGVIKKLWDHQPATQTTHLIDFLKEQKIIIQKGNSLYFSYYKLCPFLAARKYKIQDFPTAEDVYIKFIFCPEDRLMLRFYVGLIDEPAEWIRNLIYFEREFRGTDKYRKPSFVSRIGDILKGQKSLKPYRRLALAVWAARQHPEIDSSIPEKLYDYLIDHSSIFSNSPLNLDYDYYKGFDSFPVHQEDKPIWFDDDYVAQSEKRSLARIRIEPDYIRIIGYLGTCNSSIPFRLRNYFEAKSEQMLFYASEFFYALYPFYPNQHAIEAFKRIIPEMDSTDVYDILNDHLDAPIPLYVAHYFFSGKSSANSPYLMDKYLSNLPQEHRIYERAYYGKLVEFLNQFIEENEDLLIRNMAFKFVVHVSRPGKNNWNEVASDPLTHIRRYYQQNQELRPNLEARVFHLKSISWFLDIKRYPITYQPEFLFIQHDSLLDSKGDYPEYIIRLFVERIHFYLEFPGASTKSKQILLTLLQFVEPIIKFGNEELYVSLLAHADLTIRDLVGELLFKMGVKSAIDPCREEYDSRSINFIVPSKGFEDFPPSYWAILFESDPKYYLESEPRKEIESQLPFYVKEVKFLSHDLCLKYVRKLGLIGVSQESKELLETVLRDLSEEFDGEGQFLRYRIKEAISRIEKRQTLI